MKTKSFFLLLGMLNILSVMSQEISQKYGKVTKDELSMTVYPKDSSATAVVIYDNAYTSYDLINNTFKVQTECSVKIKVLKQEGVDEANISIPYYNSSKTKELVYGVEATCYNLENGAITKTKLDKKYLFNENTSENNYLVKFTIPNVKVGSIIEYKFIKTSDNCYILDEWTMQRDIPVMNCNYEVLIPEYFIFNIEQRGFETIKTKDEPKTQQFFITYSGNQQSDNVTSTSRDLIFTTKDLPALRKENYVWCVSDFKTSINFELAGTRFPNQLYKAYTHTWEDLEKTLRKETDFVINLKSSNPYKAEIKEMVEKATTEKEKIEIIYKFIKSKIQWNNTYSFLNNHPREALKKGTGNNAQINSLLIMSLRDAGIKANPVLMSRRPSGRLPFTCPSLNKLGTYLVAAETSNGKTYYMDGSSEYGGLNMLPMSLVVDRARYFDLDQEDGGKWVDLTSIGENAQIILLNTNFDANGVMTTNSNMLFNDEVAYQFKQSFSEAKDSADFIDKFKNENNLNSIDSFKMEGMNSFSNKVKANMTFTRNYDKSSEYLYINPMIIPQMSKNEFTQTERKLPVEFNYPYSFLINSTITIPENYQIVELPKPIKLVFANNEGKCLYQVTSDGNKILLLYKFNLNQTIFPQTNYPDIREFFGQVVAKNKELVVLKKIK